MSIGERIRRLRRSLDLTQKEFGEKINLKSNSIALIEGGRNTSDQTIFAICREFGVNEKWIRTGEGEMFIPAATSELEALAVRYPNMTHESYVFIEKLVNLPKEHQDIIMGFFREVVQGFGDVTPGSPANPTAAARAETLGGKTEQELKDMVGEHFRVEKEAVAKSEVS